MEREAALSIDAQWAAVKPAGWGQSAYSGERKILQHVLLGDERVMALSTATLFEQSFLGGVVGFLRTNHRGLAVATGKRALFLKQRRMGGNIEFELPYRLLEDIAEPSGGNVAEGIHIHLLRDGRWRIGRVSPELMEGYFTGMVRQLAEAEQGNG